MHLSRPGLAVLALVWAGAASASTLDVGLSNHAARLSYATPVTDTGLNADFGILHRQGGNDMYNAGLHLVDDAAQGKEPFTVGLGGELYYVDATRGGVSARGTALAIGGWFRYVFPDYNRFALRGDLHYAPNVTSFGDADRVYQLGLKGEYRVLRKASAYLGWRKARVGSSRFSGDAALDDGFTLGVAIEF